MAPNFTSSPHPCELESAIERVVTHYARRLRQLLDLSPEDLADVRQDLTVVILGALPKFERSRACLNTYLDRVLRNAATDILRRTLRDRYRLCSLHEISVDDDAEADPRVCDITGAITGKGEEADGRCPVMTATDAIDTSLTLEAFQRTLPLELLVIFRGLMLGLTASQIARQLGIGESLVRYRVKKLRTHFLAFELPVTTPVEESSRT
jgi:RNA polymerase sigma factor (sigma-70 family)